MTLLQLTRWWRRQDRRCSWSDARVNNREIATVIWLGVALAWCLWKDRASVWGLVKSFCRPSILGIVAALAGWTFGLVVVAHALGIWEIEERNDTVTWFVTVGLVLLFSMETAKEDGYFSRTARQAVAASVFVEVFVNLTV